MAIWRDSFHKRLVIAFKGTEQVRRKDWRTDLMMAPTGLNPERIGSDFKEGIQVHSGFLSAYDSVRTRDGEADPVSKWHVFVTGHSLAGALATMLALELSSSRLAKRGAISVTMYNFGSPRVGNKLFAQVYNEVLSDSDKPSVYDRYGEAGLKDAGMGDWMSSIYRKTYLLKNLLVSISKFCLLAHSNRFMQDFSIPFDSGAV